MIASSATLLMYCDPTAIYEVCDPEKNVLFPADYQRLTELCAAGQLCAYIRGARLRWIELIVPLSEVAKPHTGKERSASGAIAQDCRTIIRGHDTMALHYDHSPRICQTYGSVARQKQHQAAAKEARLGRARVRNRPVAQTFTQRASLADQLPA